jgi:8-oxo-dGTP pyrophosphatase MutT (NUDIX family)
VQILDLLERVDDSTAPEVLQRFRLFAQSSPAVFQREHGPGHFTGSAWLVSTDGRRVLLTHHRKLARWLQPGGHADGDPDLAAVALREAQEESGLRGLSLWSAEIFDLDVHPIPAYGADPEHLHWDVRFVVLAGSNEDFVVSAESHALAWVPVDSLLGENTEPSIRRMAQRWVARR